MDDAVSWGLKAVKTFGRPSDDYVLELPLIDVAVHAMEAMRRLGKTTEISDLHRMLMRQTKVACLCGDVRRPSAPW